MNPERLPEALRYIQRKACLVGTIFRESLTHPLFHSLILIDNGEMRVLRVSGDLMKMSESYERRQKRLLRSALGVATAGVLAGGVAVWNLWESKLAMDREFMNSQQSQVATLEEFADRRREFLTRGERGVEILTETKARNTLPNIVIGITGLAAFSLVVGSRLVRKNDLS